MDVHYTQQNMVSGMTDHFLGRDCYRVDEDGTRVRYQEQGPALEHLGQAARWLLFYLGKMRLGWTILDDLENVTTSPSVFSCQYTLVHQAIHQSPSSSKVNLGLYD